MGDMRRRGLLILFPLLLALAGSKAADSAARFHRVDRLLECPYPDGVLSMTVDYMSDERDGIPGRSTPEAALPDHVPPLEQRKLPAQVFEQAAREESKALFLARWEGSIQVAAVVLRDYVSGTWHLGSIHYCSMAFE